MCLPSGFILMIIVSLFFNCLHFVVGATTTTSAGGSKNSNSTLNSHVRRNDGNDRIGLRIDITRKQSIHLNGVEIDEKSLVHHLEDHERKLIFGNDDKLPRALKLVHLRHLTDVDSRYAVRKPQPQLPHRTKRAADETKAQSATERQSDAPEQQQEESLNHEVSVEIKDNDQTVSLKLQPTPKLIDDAFIFLRRYANFTQFIEDSHKLAETYERCFYSSENAALDLCDDETVRGVFQHNSTDFIIQPLPTRFGNSTHVILETDKFRPGTQKNGVEIDAMTSIPIDEHFQFEPDLEDLTNFNIMNANVEENFDDLQRKIRNTDINSDEIQGYGNLNESAHKTSNPFNLHLSYKPRFTENSHHQHHHHRQHNYQEKSTEHQNLQHQWPSTAQHRHNNQHHHHRNRNRKRRYISTSGNQRQIPSVLHIETAIFVDNDLVDHMSKNFPKNTERQLMRFVLAIINGVQLLYHHPTLGRRVNFVLKRLEILYKDPPDLGRSSDIDTYLNNFCLWQRKTNPTPDSDPLHYDHAVILTGLDLYVIVKNGKMISQVVGLAPVAGMCTPTSSCTINEGKHFESVFVVAHEIGHNLGMRHDTSDTGCDPTSHIMSPTLGTGKITWSKCSRTYLEAFLETNQANCLFDRSQSHSGLDHSAEGLLPGERFNADKQCMLKYGRDSVRATNQPLPDICRDLHCQRDRYTWTSHPALDGTECGDNMWCRSGSCVSRPIVRERNDIPRESIGPSKSNYEKAGFYENNNKREHLLHEYNQNKIQTWGAWSDTSECDSGCLYGPSNRLREGSTGLRTYVRLCLDRRRCLGRDKRYESCIAKQCYNIKKTTIEEFATNVCEKAQKFDVDLTGRGEQIVGDIEESCKVFCRTKNNDTKSRAWTFPDGTTCHSKHYNSDAIAYCIGGRCEKFSCDNTSVNYYKIDQKFCRYNEASSSSEMESRRSNNYNSIQPAIRRDGDSINERNSNNYNRQQNRIYGPTTVHSKYENEVAVRHFHGQSHDSQFKHKSDSYNHWNKYNYRLNDHYPLPANQPVAASLKAAPSSTETSEWIVKSGCHSSCMAKSKGVQVVTSRRTGANNIQLCTHTVKPCDHLLTPSEYAENTCARYKLKVRGLSGYGTQIAASVDDPDRSCRVGCQDEFIKYRFYLVNGKYGHFPLGTKCSNTEERYCVNGKCLEFGHNDIPLQQSHISLALYRNRRSIDENNYGVKDEGSSRRSKRSFLYYSPINITETITQEFINSIVNSIINYERKQFLDDMHSDDHIEFTNPIHMSMDELSMK